MPEKPPTEKRWLKKKRNRFSRFISEKNHRSKLVVVSAVSNGAAVLAGTALAFSLPWPLWLVILSWTFAILVLFVVAATTILSYDVSEFEKESRKSAGDLQEELTATQGKLANAEQAHRDYGRAIKGALLPLAGILQEIPLARTSADAQARLGDFRGMAVHMLYQTAGTSSRKDAARATLYELDASHEPLLRISAGRPETPRQRFVDESLEKVMKLINRGDTKRFDVDSSDNCVVPSPGSRYKAVVATAIGRTEPRHGMLTVDSSDAQQLSDDDWPIIQSIGGMLAASYRIVTLVEELEAARRDESDPPLPPTPNGFPSEISKNVVASGYSKNDQQG